MSANTTEAPVLISEHGAVLTIELNRPARRNAIDGASALLLRAAFDRLEAESRFRVGILTGSGGSFCSGADLRAGFAGERIRDEFGFASFIKRERSKPVIAAVEGPAYAGGFELVLAADMVVASQTASFCLSEVKRGVMAGSGIYQLQRQLPHATARYLVLTGEPMDAARAYELGLVSELVPAGQALSGALALADRLSGQPRTATVEAYRYLRSCVNVDKSEAERLAQQGLERLSQSADFGEGAQRYRRS